MVDNHRSERKLGRQKAGMIVNADAGLAGGQCARDIAARGHEVGVLETESKIV
ncbi:hypothetical protein [Halalkalicoccus subterraneus]|uniref:hypothetical protein n=1 Tax=Halalkalicoccus subterraneus TaxID=2675002 RepID=UPI0013CE58BC|nr:hypothetical protein [Halalkalicoccus subterraneus]